MSEHTPDIALLVLLVGGLVILAIFAKSFMKRIGIPVLVGFMMLGFILRIIDHYVNYLNESSMEIFDFLGSLGVFALLFKIGMESNIKKLLSRLKESAVICYITLFVSGIVGFSVTYWILGQELIPSLFVGAAMVATSVGVSVGTWKSEGVIKTKNGEMLLDIAELDDISGVILMGLLFAVSPLLRGGGGGNSLALVLGKSALKYLGLLLLIGSFCFLFSRYLEKPMRRFFQQCAHKPDPMLLIAGVGIIIASVAGLLGFSIAMGAFFAGLAFSRDPEAVKMESSFDSLYDFFTPFFFISIGLKIDPSALSSAAVFGLILLAAAILGKFIGTFIPSLFYIGIANATLLGVSMIPRAEITLIIMENGLSKGKWAVSSKLYSSMVIVSAGTCILAPVALHSLLRKWPQKEESS